MSSGRFCSTADLAVLDRALIGVPYCVSLDRTASGLGRKARSFTPRGIDHPCRTCITTAGTHAPQRVCLVSEPDV